MAGRSLAALSGLPGENLSLPKDIADARARADRIIQSTVDSASARTGSNDRSRGVSSKPRPKSYTQWPMRWIAGPAVALVLAATIGVMMTRPRLPDAASAARTYTTQTGERVIVTLADGSTVTLAPRTTLRVLHGYGATHRMLSLDGQAFFDVHSVGAHPFIIHAGNAETRVLGTAFDVRHYATDLVTRVAVTQGKVTVSARERVSREARSREPLVVTDGRVAQVSDSSATLMPHDSAGSQVAWTNGTLVFRRAAAAEILTALTRWYGYEFRFASRDSTALAATQLTAWFTTRSSAEALANVELLLNVDAIVRGNVVTLHPRRRASLRRQAPYGRTDTTFSARSEVGR
jgi:transmembrane sensor